MDARQKKFNKQNVQDILPLTSMQEGMLFHYLENPASTMYLEQLSLHISGKVDFQFVNKAWDEVVKANEMLRTVFRWEKLPKPMQIILKEYQPMVRNYDFTHLDLSGKEKQVDEIREKDHKKGIDISVEPFRITAIKLSDHEFIMIISNHHILFDGWSNGIILKEFLQAYSVLCNGDSFTKPNKRSFKEFVKWLQSQDQVAQRQYWTQYLEGFETKTLLPRTLSSRTLSQQSQTSEIGRYQVQLDEDITDRLNQFVTTNRITAASIFNTAWALLLQRYNNTDDVVFGTTVSGRSGALKGLEEMVGLFINTIPFRVRASFDESISTLLNQIDQGLKERTAYENVPLVDIKTCSMIDPQESLFDSIVVIENYPLDKQLNETNNQLKIESYSMVESTHFDLTLLIEMNDQIQIQFSYNQLVFSKQLIRKLSKYFYNILNHILENPHKKVSEIEMLTEEEQNMILHEFNDTYIDYPRDKTLNQLFEEQVERVPDQIAVVYEDQHLTYRELNEKANQLATTLRDKGVTADSIVGILTERSFEMMIGIMAILKAGGAYVPITPEYPEDRIQYILQDSNTEILLTQSQHIGKVSFTGEVIDLTDEFVYSSNGENLEAINTATNIAYVIYTSGSTGQPKGVIVEHQSVVNILTNMQRDYPLMEDGTYLLKTTYTFDVSVTELFGWYMGAGRMAILPPGGEKNPHIILEAIDKYNVTHMNFVPSMLNVFIDGIREEDFRKLKSLRYLFVAGEAFSKELAKRCSAKLKNITVENIYGPTETTIYVTRYSTIHLKEESFVPIGKPLNNVKAYIVNKHNKLLPIGAAGELCIAGECLARGYFNREDLTAEKFVTNPFVSGEKMYRTGDLVRWLPDGNIEFLGRIDHQVKIRGFRIELGEIESQLLSYETIKEVIVMDREDQNGAKYLCAYIVADQEVTVVELREFLLRGLPEYMVPSYFVQLEEMPLNANGKLDRKALPEPEGKMNLGTVYEAPRNDVEEKLVAIWQEVLGIDQVGINDKFFELGGHSLKATRILGRIHKELGVEIPIKQFFDTPTIKELSVYIQNTTDLAYTVIEKVQEKEVYETSSAQKRLYMIQQLDLASTGYHMSTVFLVKGKLELSKLEEIFLKLIQRHENLRTSFSRADEQIVQKIHPEIEFQIEEIQNVDKKIALSWELDLVIEKAMNQFIRPFDLNKAPLFRVGVVQLDDNKYILLFDMHHIISDGVSMTILIDEFIRLYEGQELDELRIQYRDYAEWQNKFLHSDQMHQQEKYWLNLFDDGVPVLNLPTDYNRPSMQSLEGDLLSYTVERELTRELKETAEKTGSTMYMILLSAINIMLAKYSGQDDLVIGTPIAGRVHPDLEKIMGMFVNTLAMRNQPAGDKTYEEFLEEVRENAFKAYENQDYPFERLVDGLHLNRDLSRNPLFDVMFAMQNIDQREVQVQGLSIASYPYSNKTTKFDLSIQASEVGEELQFDVEYCTKLFKRETIQQMISHLRNILQEIITNPKIRLSEIEMLTSVERDQILYTLNEVSVDYSQDKTISQLFEEQVEKTPDQIAVVYEDQYLTYRELNEQANRLAWTLRDQGVQTDQVVGLLCERSLEMMVGIVSILKAGGAYMPISPDYPQERIQHMMENSQAKILLGQGKLLTKQWIHSLSLEIKTVDLDDPVFYTGNSSNLNSMIQPDDLAYVIYTSGSTGKPKGVMIEQKSVVSLVAGLSEIVYKRYEPQLKVALVAPYYFDASVQQIFATLLLGHTLCIVPEDTRLEGRRLLEFYHKHEIQISDGTPVHISLLANTLQIENEHDLKVKHLIIGGEALPGNVVRDFYTRFASNKPLITNIYGPTECCVDSTAYLIDPEELDQRKVLPIGIPLPNEKIYILGQNAEVLPMGVIGEVYISGEGVSRGYLNNPELTAETFIDNPFILGTRMYRTGDLARWLPDGNLEFLGRSDHQVKIRGFRIELGEIETQLSSYEALTEAIVIVREDQEGTKYLCAYIVPNREVTTKELRDYLAKNLPDYMIPAHFVSLDRLPINQNGKIDRKALPEPEGKVNLGTEYEAPRNDVEERLVGIWQEVLGIDQIGINDNFFELGGHSLKATRISGKIYKEFDVEISLKQIFTTPTIKGLSPYLQDPTDTTYVAIKKVSEKEVYETSSAQKRLYMIQQLDLASTGYHMSAVFQVEGKLDLTRVEETFLQLIQRHENLRTSFSRIDERIVQKIHPEVEFNVEYIQKNVATCGEATLDVVIKTAMDTFIRPFDLSKAPLFRVGVIPFDENTHILLFDMHHIISDGISMAILVEEFAKLYEGFELDELRIQYRDYAEWQNQFLQSDQMNQQEEYWLNLFGDEVPVLNLPTDYNRPSMQSLEGDLVSYTLDRELTIDLNRIAQETGSTMYMILLSGINILLSKYSGQDDLIIGTPIAGRAHPDLEKIMGMFVNTLAMRNQPAGDKSYEEFLEEVRENVFKAYANQDYQFERLVDRLHLNRDLSRNPLFDVMFAMQNMERREVQVEDLCFTPYSYSNKTTKFDVTISASEVTGELVLDIEYSISLFKRETMKQMVLHLKNILSTIVSKPKIKLSEIEMISAVEKERLLYEFNNTQVDFPKDKTIDQLFEEQVQKNPDQIAVVFEDQKLTYRELNEKANCLANVLRGRGVKADTVVGIMVERSHQMIIGILAILKAGGAYLPIDMEYPKERIQFMMDDCSINILLIQNQENMKHEIDTVSNLIDIKDEKIYSNQLEDQINIEKNHTSEYLAYIIYTSGSTGKPKGVMIEHRNVIRLVKNTNYVEFGQGSKLLQTGTLAFDASTFEIWGALLNGMELHLAQKDLILSTELMEQYLMTNEINTLFLTTALLNLFAEERPEMFKNLTNLLTGGEAISPNHVRKVQKVCPNLNIVNLYGPTENSSISTSYQLSAADESLQIPIGKPINNSTAYIFDQNNNLCPIGVYGELCMGGEGLARGYLNRPDLTAEKFIENPYILFERIYKTGDLVRWLPDGNIEFLGRVDHQVKIRGHRIELGEIEKCLLEHELVKEAIVVAQERDQGNKYICAYLVPHKEVSNSEIRAYLAMNLADYMIPSYFVQLDMMPLNRNGKVDRKALPKPDGDIVSGVEYEAPRNKTEEELVEIWQEVLGINQIGINDNFFELGGHSLKATILAGKMHKALKIEVPLNQIFATPTIKGISEFMQGSEKMEYFTIEKTIEKDGYEASSAQKRTYLLQQFDLDSTRYNISTVLEVHGLLDLIKVQSIFQTLIQRHETLRTSFETRDEQIVQIVNKKVEFEVEQIEAEEPKEKIDAFIRVFDLSKAPLFRIGVMRFAEDYHILILDMHHIISDGTSMGILIKEFTALYDGKAIDELRIQYKDFSEWQNQRLQSDQMKQQKEYWVNHLSDELPVLNLPTDYVRPTVQSIEGDQIQFQLDQQLTTDLYQVAKKTGSTMYMVLLSAINILMHKYSGQEDLIIGSPIAGRPHPELNKIIGMFVNTLAMRNKPERNKTYEEFLKEVKENALLAYENQDVQFEELVELLNLNRDLSRNPLFDVMFTMQNMDIGELQLRNLTFTPYNYERKSTAFDLTFSASEMDNVITFVVEYSTKLFKREMIKQMSSQLKVILEKVAADPKIKLSTIEMLSEEERTKILYDFNQTSTDHLGDQTIHQLFEARVVEKSDEIAVIYEDRNITYFELNERANKLARKLREKGVTHESIVGVFVDRSIEMMVGILGILKAGGAYLPINSTYPEERVRYMLEDSGAEIVLTHTHLKEGVLFDGLTIVLEDETNYMSDGSNLDIAIESHSLAYVIYTSGSTGQPKGVMVEHQSVLNTLSYLQKQYPLEKDGTYLLKTTYSFDVSVSELFGWFMGQGRLAILPPDGEKDVHTIMNTISRFQVTHINFVPSMLNVFLTSLSDTELEKIRSLKYMFVAGEAFSKELAQRCLMKIPQIQVENLYGPTETTIYVTQYSLRNLTDERLVPIGKPLDNVQAYILNPDQQLLPIGVAGELCFSGQCLTRGYFNQSELTAEKFVDNPFIPGRKLYKTGDLAKWLPDGNIQFLGRVDHQVKIRGYRIEPGEIENQLLKYEPVKEVVVIPREDGNGSKYLYAYIVANKVITVGELREHLLTTLPEYMVPAHFVQLEKLPLTANGKIDRKALPEPAQDMAVGTEYVAPRNETEEKLVQIWKVVLGIDRVGINDHFFELGGHSLKVTILVGKIHKEFDIRVPVSEVFKRPTVKGICEYMHSSRKTAYANIAVISEQEYYQVSSAQKRMYMLQQFDLQSMGYNMPAILEIEGKLELEKVERAFLELMLRHESLRTSFEVKESILVQKVNQNLEFQIEQISQGDQPVAKVIQDFIRPFDLSQAPLFRVGVIELETERYILIFDMHHIISDGVSMGIFVSEFTDLYKGKELEQLRIQYKDFAEWQNQFLQSDLIKDQEEYWLSQFSDQIPVLNLPTDYPRPIVQSLEGDQVRFIFDQEMTQDLYRIAKQTGSTLYMVLLSGINILLAKYSGQEDIIVGSTIAGRPHADLEKVIGMFVNTLAMRNQPVGNKSYDAFLQEVSEHAIKAYENQDYQFEELVEQLNIRRDPGRNPLFDVMFSMQNMNMENVNLHNLTFKPYDYDTTISKFDLSITATEIDEEIHFVAEYSVQLFKRETIERMITHLKNIFNTVSTRMDIYLSEIEMLTGDEKAKILYDFNDTCVDFSKDQTIQQLFEEQVVKTPHEPAVVYKGIQMTYLELNERANRLAWRLRQLGVGPDQIVGVIIESSFEQVIGLLSILKAGGAYLPIDPNYPVERIEYMLKDVNAELLLTKEDMKQVEFAGLVVNLEDPELYSGEPVNLPVNNQSTDLAYIIYTSGSTGRPKGVMVEHQNVVNILTWFGQRYDLKPGKRMIQLTNFTFDPAVEQIFGTLIHGATVYLIDRDLMASGDQFEQYIEENQIQIINFVPSALRELLLQRPGKLNSLETVISGGERLDEQTKDELLSRGYLVHNHYGPTETTIDALTDQCSTGKVVLGRPVANTQCYILNAENNLVPIGVVGELCIAGAGVSRGYLNNPELTAEKFIENPFKQGQKMYRTGDLARWMSDGRIEFLGRMDHQVKIRGFRIELGEIENQLLKIDSIEEVVVVAREEQSGVNYLAAYLVAEQEISASRIREELQKKLPDYMIPAYFIQLDKMPLTSNGKMNRQELPEPAGNVAGTEFEAPRNLTEETLVQIWTEVLGIDRIGINDNFFELGGHSLKATVLIAKIHQELDVEISLSEVFKCPTIKELAQLIVGSEENLYSSIQSVDDQEYYPTSSAQKRIYVQCQFEDEGLSYNMPGAVVVEGKLQLERLEYVFEQLVERHETLRTSFELIGGEVVQRVLHDVEFEIERIEGDQLEVQQILEQFLRPFDLKVAPLIRIGLAQLAAERYVMCFDLHHIISDGVSMKNLIEEFIALYQGIELPELKIQYKDFAVWQNELFKTKAIENQKTYWIETFTGEIPILNLPTDYPRPSIQSFRGSVFYSELDNELAKGLKELAVQTGSTLYMVLLAAYNVLLFKYTGQEDLIIGSPIAGRRHADLQKLIGVFINMLALRNQPCSSKTFGEFLAEVKENTLRALDHQDYQFEELVEKLNLHRDLSRNPLFDLVFSFQDTTSQSLIEADGLRFIPHTSESNISKFDLTLEVVEEANQMWLSLEYCTDLFAKETMERFAHHFVNLLRKITTNPDVTLGEVDILSETERIQLLEEFNATEMEYARDKTLHELFVEQVDRTPEKIALVFADERLTYQELNSKVNQLALRLRELGVVNDEIVAIMAERSMEMLIGILSILKAGGAYMPIDPDYPIERITYMLEDSQAQILLTQSDDVNQIEYTGHIINVTDPAIYTGESKNLLNSNSPRDLAYVMYTSGSTGKPKGVMIEHRGVVSLSEYYNQMFNLDQGKHILHLSNVSFDTSVVEIFPPLIYGSTVYIIEKELALDRKRFIKYVQENQIHFAQFVPMMLQEILSQSEKPGSLETVIVGGDKLDDVIKDQILSLGYQLTNHYGPTESTVDAIVARCTKGKGTIGKPIANTRAYILDKNNNLTPIGVPGELCISGVGLARGYLNKPELTAEKFNSNPWISHERIYRTGDLACWQSDGNITFLGRIDNQVKIRGYRIELGEIELQLMKHPDITGAVVIDKLDANGIKYLCAYIVAESELTAVELRDVLSRDLPDYMIPSYFMQLERLPLTHNGKVDRRALPEPEGGLDTGVEYIAPTNDVEEKLVILWQDVLGVEKIGINYNFFEMGGHSLKATILVSKIHEQLNVEVPFTAVFKNPTIKELAQSILKAEQNIYASIQPVEEQEYYAVSSSQRRLYIQWQLAQDSKAYNMPSASILHGELDQIKLKHVIQELGQRHEALRTSFKMVEGEPVQKIHKDVEISLTYLEVEEEELHDLVEQLVQPFDLSRAPLLRVILIRFAENRHLLFFDMHHIISDGVSLAILNRDFASLYTEKDLPSLRVQYKDYAAWHNKLLESTTMEKFKKYWMKKLSHFSYTELPQSTISSGDELEGRIKEVIVDQALTEAINTFCLEHKMTKFAFLLGVFKVILMKAIKQDDLTIGIPVAGRGSEELEKMIGVFLNVMVMRTQIEKEVTFQEYLNNLRDDLMEAQEHQNYPYESLYGEIKDAWNFRENSLFSILFNYMPYQGEEELELDEISIQPYKLEEMIPKYSFTLYVNEGRDQISLNALYSSNLEERLIEIIMDSFPVVIGEVLNQENVLIKEIHLAEDDHLDQYEEDFDMEFDNDDFF